MKKYSVDERYNDNFRKQQKIMENFSEHEIEWANHLIQWYQRKNEEMPDDEYRACAFFINKEFLRKTGSLTLLYEMYLRCGRELPDVTKENAFDILRFRYKMYAKLLENGGFS